MSGRDLSGSVRLVTSQLSGLIWSCTVWSYDVRIRSGRSRAGYRVMAGLLVSPALDVESRQVLAESSLPLGSVLR